MRGLRGWGVLVFVSVGLFAFRQSSTAQTTDATITGQITDPSGRVASGVAVALTNVNTNILYTAQTNTDGIYRLVGLRPGIYRANVTKDGFKGIVKDGIELHVQDNVSINFTLQVGSVVETVTVKAGAPLVNTESATVSTVVDRQLVDNLPLNGRSFQALINLTPGVVLTGANFAWPGQFSINGQRSDANYFTVDGVSANVAASTGVGLTQYGAGVYPAFSASGGTNSLVSIDALEEFRVQTSTFAPEYGRVPGGQVSIMTRSGANQFHGTAFEYFRNDVLDANDWFANSVGNKKSALRQNDFGGVFSGPIRNDRLFFFYSYEGLRLRLPQTLTEEVPSASFRSGANPAMQALLNAFPIPNGAMLANGLQNFTGSFTNPSSLDATSLRIDYAASKRWSMFGRYNYAPSSTATRGDPSQILSPSEVDHFNTTTQTLTYGAGITINPRLANEFRFNFSRITTLTFSTIDTFGGAVPFSSSAVFPSGFSFSNALLDFNVYGLTIIGPILEVGANSHNLQRQINFVDNVSYSRGAHLLKFGVDYRRLSPDQHPPAYSQLVGFLDETSAQNGSAYVQSSASRPTTNFIFTNLSFFAQDAWKLSHRLTLTYGLRWDFNPVPSSGDSTPAPYTLTGLTNVSTVNPATLTSLAAAGTPLYKNSYSDFAPRVGAAFQFRDNPNWTSVFRGGFGVFSNISNSVFGDASSGFPFIASQILFPTSFPAPTLAPPALGSTAPPYGRIFVTDPNLKSPYSLQWNASFEQQLGTAQALSISYIGAVGRRLIYQDYFYSPNANFNFISLSLNGATSNYNALQLQFHRRVTHGLQTLASYTWSHTLDTDSNTEGSVLPQRGNADYDIRHSFTMGTSYELPNPSLTKFAGAMLKNWTLDGSVYARTAAPVNLVGGFVFAPAFFEARPDIVVPRQPFYISDPNAPGGRRINAAAFTPAPSGQQGNLGRNVLRGLNAWQADFAVRRDFHLQERVALQFRTEMFNIFNHPNFGPPYQFLGAPQFGVPTQTLAQSLGSGGANGGFNPLYQIGGPRSIQLALKLQF
jgi:outer membrane receptor protein involved in Fe transport